MKPKVLLILASILLQASSQIAWSQAAADLARSTGSPSTIYHGTDLEHVDTHSGNLHITLPLLHLAGRGLDTDMVLSYNSKLWQSQFSPSDPIVTNLQGSVTTGLDMDNGFLSLPTAGVYQSPGWSLGVPRMGSQSQVSSDECYQPSPSDPSNCLLHIGHSTWIQSDGTRIALVSLFDGISFTPPQGEMTSFDGSFALLTSRGLIYKDGVTAAALLGQKTLTDTNGNSIACTNSAKNSLAGCTDTLGRHITLNNDSITGLPQTMVYLDSAGVSRTIVFQYSTFSLEYPFTSGLTACTGGVAPAVLRQLLTGITLANGLSYQFQYLPNPDGSTTGEISKIILPTGGYFRYQYDSKFVSNDPGLSRCGVGSAFGFIGQDRVVVNRFVSPDGTAASEQSWSYDYGNGPNQIVDGIASQVFTITDPLGNKQIDAYDQGTPLSHHTDYIDASGKVLKTLKSVVEQGSVTTTGPAATREIADGYWYLNAFNNPRYKSTTTILPDTNQQSQTTFTYGAFNNVLEKDETDWGIGAPGSVIRKTTLSYLADSDARYDADLVHILDRVSAENVCDAAGTFCEQTSTTFDGAGTLSGTTNVIQHDYANFSVANTNRGNPTQISRAINPAGGVAVTKHSFNDVGNLLQVTDPMNHVTSFAYDDNYASGTSPQPTSAFATAITKPATNGISHVQRSQYYFNTGLLAASCDENFPSGTRCATGLTGLTSDYGYISYDALGRAQAVNFGDGGQTSFTYIEASLPISVVNTKKIDGTHNLVQTTVYDGLGRSSQVLTADPSGTVYRLTSYDALGRTDRAYNPTRCNPPQTNCGESTWGYTSYVYDGLGRVTQTIPPDGTAASPGSPCLPNNNCSLYTGNAVTQTDETGRQRRSITDALGRLVEVDEPGAASAGTAASGTLNIGGSLKSVSGVGAFGAQSARLQFTVTGTNHLLPAGKPFKCPRPPQICDPPPADPFYDNGKVAITVNGHEYDYFFGQGPSGDTAASVAGGLALAIQSDPSRLVNAQVVGTGGNIVQLTAVTPGAVGNSIFASTSWTWDTVDFPTQGASFSIAAPTSGNLANGVNGFAGNTVWDTGTVSLAIGGYSAQVCYGVSGQCAAVPLASGCAAGNSDATQISCLLAYNIRSLSPPFTISASGGQININWSSNTQSGNVAVTATSNTTQTTYFSAPSFVGCSGTCGAATTNPQSYATATAGGRDPLPPNLSANFYTTLYQYDALGNLLRVDQKGSAPSDSSQWRTRLFAYDSLSRLLTAQNPESGTITYSYDADGNLLQKTSPLANQTGAATQTISYCYDELHRVTGKAYSAQSCPLNSPVVTFGYDAAANAKGRLAFLTDQAGQEFFAYDAIGRLALEDRVIGNVSKTMTYDYNLDGSIKTIHYPSGAAVTYTADSAGHMISAIDSGNNVNYVTGASYQADGQLTGFVSGSASTFAGMTNTFNYNNRLQPVNMSASSPSQTVFSIGYDFHNSAGNNGNVWGITNYKDNTRSQSFTYDSLNRLTSAQNAGTNCAVTTVNAKTEYWGNSYGYDAWGNLVNKTVTKCGAENLSAPSLVNNQLSGYGYDAAGNMTSDPTDGLTLNYDQENRITGAAGYTYTYDADGNRVKKSNGTTGTLYWYMSPGIVAESDLSGTLKSEYVFFDGERVARRDFVAPAGISYYFSDHLKTASVITDSLGNIKSESDYYPWGGELQFVANDSNHYKFTGKERDAETGLDYFGARYYSNGLARFITPDWAAKAAAVPYADFADPQSLNLYTYVRNVPTSKVDVDGHCAPWCVGAAIGLVVGAGIEAGMEMYKGEDLSLRKIAGAALGGAIAGGTLGLASGAGVGVTILAGAVGNTAGGVVERGVATGDIAKTVDPKAMAKDAAWGAAAGLASKGAGKIGERVGGEKQLEAVGQKLKQTSLGERHAGRLAKQQTALSVAVARGGAVGEHLGHHAIEAAHKVEEEQHKNEEEKKNGAK